TQQHNIPASADSLCRLCIQPDVARSKTAARALRAGADFGRADSLGRTSARRPVVAKAFKTGRRQKYLAFVREIYFGRYSGFGKSSFFFPPSRLSVPLKGFTNPEEGFAFAARFGASAPSLRFAAASSLFAAAAFPAITGAVEASSSTGSPDEIISSQPGGIGRPT